MAESISELQKKVTKAEKLSWSYTGLQNKKKHWSGHLPADDLWFRMLCI
jgi:hypothetical protein